MMGQIAQAVKNAPLTSTADRRGVMPGTKAMRSALKLRVEPTSFSVSKKSAGLHFDLATIVPSTRTRPT